MSEKRFTKCDTKIRDNGEEMTQAEVRDMLNKLHDENEQLKSIKKFADRNGICIFNIDEAFRRCWQDNAKLVKENEELKKDLFKDSNQSKYITVQKTIILDLKKENKELKKELVKFKKWEKHIGDVKREELDRVFKMSIYEIAEAFDYYKERIEKTGKELQE